MSGRIIVWIPFGDMLHQGNPDFGRELFGKGPGNPAWWTRRADLFKRFTLRSLEQQSDRDFEVWCGVASITSPMAGPLRNVIAESSLGDRISIYEHDVEETMGRGQGPVWSAVIDALSAGETTFCFLDSDDMYHRDFISRVRAVQKRPGLVIYCQQGFIVDEAMRCMHVYDPQKCPAPFFARYYPGDIDDLDEYEEEHDFLDVHSHLLQHEVRESIGHGLYCVLIHGANSTSTWENPQIVTKLRDEVRDIKSTMEGFR